ncbi:hemerythrin domain-containing protein [Streptomyces sp. NPDC088197]|uniref:hemerythrin domain-containing protein n=1 Tax=unclassified Streptomyces TaxID=2593676 RepID=UPI00381D774F
MSTYTPSDAQSRLDFTMMYAVHDAFRRDLGRLVTAADHKAGSPRAFKEGWKNFTYYLDIHHTAEDTTLWPAMRGRIGSDPERVALLDAMEAEHAVLDPLIAAVDARLAAGDTAGLSQDVERLRDALTSHFDHEEDAGLPLVGAVVTAKQWDAFGAEQRRQVGTKGAATFFPWLLDSAPAATEQKVLALVPPPVRFLFRKTWRPRYEKQSPWAK